MSAKLTNAWIYSPTPPPSVTNLWVVECISGGTHIVVHGPTKDFAQERLYLDYPHLRGVVNWIYDAPPKRRRDEPRPAAAPTIEHDSIAFTALAKAFHPDTAKRKRWTSDQVMQVINGIRDSMKGDK